MSVDESSYTAKRGSLILELRPSFLEGLPIGKHVVTALFDDGNAQASFVVTNKKSDSAVGPSDDGTPGADGARPAANPPSASASVPQTGDGTPISVMLVLCVCGFASLAACVRARRRG